MTTPSRSIQHKRQRHPKWLPKAFTTQRGLPITSEVTGNVYVVHDYLAEGAFGIVFSGSDAWENDLVIKVLKPQPGTLDVAQKELEALIEVRHPNVVHLHDAFVLKEAICIVSSRCERTLLDFMSSRGIQPRLWVRGLARCLFQALHFSHVRGYAHCDIHAGNVFLHSDEGEMAHGAVPAYSFKLGDFGLARRIGAMAPTGTFLDGIRPPEAIDVAEFGPLDHRADLYQAGMLLLQFLTGGGLHFTQEQILDGLPQEVALFLAKEDALFVPVARLLRRHAAVRPANALGAWVEFKAAIDQ